MNNLRISQVVNELSFQYNEDQNNNNINNNNKNNPKNFLNINLKSSFLILEELNNTFKKNISQSIF